MDTNCQAPYTVYNFQIWRSPCEPRFSIILTVGYYASDSLETLTTDLIQIMKF